MDPPFTAIRAALDDDAPRLVWADQMGGERGELVVVQCRLAGELSDEERRALTAREAELLSATVRHPSAFTPGMSVARESWPGKELLGLVHACRFERGFVEHVHMETAVLAHRSAELFAAAPCLRSIDLTPAPFSTMNSVPGRSTEQYWTELSATLRRALEVLPEQVRALTIEPAVWEFGNTDIEVSYGFGDDCARVLAEVAPKGLRRLTLKLSAIGVGGVRLLSSLPLTEVSFAGHRLGGAGCAETVRCLGHATRFAFSSGEPAVRHLELAQLLVEPALSRVVALDLTLNGLDTGDAENLAACAQLSRLADLDLRHNNLGADAFAAIRASPWIGRVKLLT